LALMIAFLDKILMAQICESSSTGGSEAEDVLSPLKFEDLVAQLPVKDFKGADLEVDEPPWKPPPLIILQSLTLPKAPKND